MSKKIHFSVTFNCTADISDNEQFPEFYVKRDLRIRLESPDLIDHHHLEGFKNTLVPEIKIKK